MNCNTKSILTPVGRNSSLWPIAVSIAAGVLLLTAALLKILDNTLPLWFLSHREFGVLVFSVLLAAEISLGLVLVISSRARIPRVCGSLVFLGFAVFSLYIAIGGATSCGCFGSLKVNPWITASLDLLMSLLLYLASKTDQHIFRTKPVVVTAAALLGAAAGMKLRVPDDVSLICSTTCFPSPRCIRR